MGILTCQTDKRLWHSTYYEGRAYMFFSFAVYIVCLFIMPGGPVVSAPSAGERRVASVDFLPDQAGRFVCVCVFCIQATARVPMTRVLLGRECLLNTPASDVFLKQSCDPVSFTRKRRRGRRQADYIRPRARLQRARKVVNPRRGCKELLVK